MEAIETRQTPYGVEKFTHEPGCFYVTTRHCNGMDYAFFKYVPGDEVARDRAKKQARQAWDNPVRYEGR